MDYFPHVSEAIMVFDYKSPCMRVIISAIFVQFTTDPFQPQSLCNPSCDKQLLNKAKPSLSDGKPRWLPVLEMMGKSLPW